jgi:ribosomal protein L24
MEEVHTIRGKRKGKRGKISGSKFASTSQVLTDRIWNLKKEER